VTPRHELIRLWYFDRVLAHRTLFAHRHPEASPPFHDSMIEAWHSPSPRDLFKVFRGGAKSTIGEEALVVRAAFREFRNLLVVGNTFERALERLNAIRHELETNEKLITAFGDLRGPTWTDGELVTSTGIRLLALGKGQALRGTKHHDMRPDGAVLDDIEDRSDVKTPKARKETRQWLMKELMPAMTPDAWIRINATPLDVESLTEHLEKSGEWAVHKYPIKYLDDNGEWRSSWPERFSMKWIDWRERTLRQLGLGADFQAEYMVSAEHDEDKVFKNEMYRTEPTVRSWQAVYGAFDPARTSKPSSAQTGHCAWSYYRNDLIVWEAWGKHLQPNEIVASVFDFHDAYRPVEIGVEVDGVNDFLTQPIRTEMKTRGELIPITELKAPNGKIDFIKSLQPWFFGRNVIFAKDFQELRQQLNSVPTGLMDIANALAYALKMRPGAPIYEHFGSRHIADELIRLRNEPAWLIVNAVRGGFVTGALVQYHRGALRVLEDYIREGDASAVLMDIVNAANLRAGRRVELVAPPIHWDQHLNVGLRQAAVRIPIDIRQGLKPEMGRAARADLLAGHGRDDEPLVYISPDARWTLNALSGGYCRGVEKGGKLTDYAKEGPYRVLVEGLESFAGLISVMGSPNGEADDRTYAHTPSGQRYQSALRR
jgi:hypothetical protein